MYYYLYIYSSKSIYDHFINEGKSFNFTEISFGNFTPTCDSENDIKKFKNFISSILNTQQKCACINYYSYYYK